MLSDRPTSIVPFRPTARTTEVGSAVASDAPRRAVRPIAVGTLIALPILAAPDGTPFDLLEATEGHGVVLVFVPADAVMIIRDYLAVATSLADRMEAAAGRMFIIARQAEAVDDPGMLLLDRDGGFAYSLGLAGWDEERGCADLYRPVGLAFDKIGNVVAADLGGSPDLGRLVATLASVGTADPGRVRRW